MNTLLTYIQEALVKKNTTVIQADEYVDLGLPSGVKWATCNLGADEPEEYGLYFAWGETKGFTSNEVKSGKRLFDGKSYQYTENPKTLSLLNDAAHVMLGGKWRMPTDDEIKELKDNCNNKLEKLNGVKGCRLTSKINRNSIFIPFAGYGEKQKIYAGSHVRLWSSSLNYSSPNLAYYLHCAPGLYILSVEYRNNGLAIRPVYK